MGEIIWTLVATVTAFLGGIAGKMVSDEAADYCERVTRLLTDASVLLLPSHARDRYAEEWAAYLDEHTGKLTKLAVAIGLYFGALRLARTLPPSASPAQQARLIELAQRIVASMNFAFDRLAEDNFAELAEEGIARLGRELQSAVPAALRTITESAQRLDADLCAEFIMELEGRTEHLAECLAELDRIKARQATAK
jgi:hypothetical protein